MVQTTKYKGGTWNTLKEGVVCKKIRKTHSRMLEYKTHTVWKKKNPKCSEYNILNGVYIFKCL